MSGGIPAIDIAPFLDGSDKPSVARQVAEACERIGFVIVSGHGIEPAVIDRAFERSWAFFDRPRAEKDRWHPRGPSRQRGFHGFATRGLAYTLGEETPPDLRETYFLGPVDDHRGHFANPPDAANAYAPNIYPDAPEGAAGSLIAIYRAYERLSADLLRIFAVALHQPEDYFAGFIGRHFSILSSHHYPALQELPKPGQLRTGAHTDYGALTILAMTEADGGLEVRMADGAWQPVRPARGALVVNLGDMMARWTNGSLDLDPAPGRQSARSRERPVAASEHRLFHASRLRCADRRDPVLRAGRRSAALPDDLRRPAHRDEIAASHDGAAVARDSG